MKKTLIFLSFIFAFADSFGQAKISQLPTTTTLTGTELVPVVQSGVTKQTTASQIASLAISTIPSSVLTTSGSQSVSNKSGNISQWTNDAGYLTSASASVYVPYSGANSFTTSNNITMGQLITNTIAAKASDSLSFYTNAIERLKIKSDGTFRFLSTSSTNTASGSMWYNVSSGTGSAAPTGFTFYNPTNSFWEKVATFRNQSTGIHIQLSNSTASMAGWLKPMRNQGVGIQDSSGTTGLRVDQGGKVVINPASTTTHVANFTILGTGSVQSTFSVASTLNASDIRAYGGNHLNLNSPAANVLIGTGGNVYAAINSSGMNVGNSSAPGGATLRVLGAGTFSASSTASVGGLNIISGGYSVTTKGINTTSGDAATINSPIGRFRKDNSGSSFTLTNSQITANSIIVLTLISTGITTGYQMSVQAGSGSAVITFETAGVAAAPSADCDVNFMIMN